jgi:outer membrane protein assembly factor BamB
MKASSSSRILLVLLLVFVLGGCFWFAFCNDESAADSSKTDETTSEPSVVTHTWPAPEAVDLTRLEGLTEKTLSLTDAQKFPDCHLIFEPEGVVEENFPLKDPQTRTLKLAGCNPEAHRFGDDGTRYVAYAVPADGPSWDLRLAAYAQSGKAKSGKAKSGKAKSGKAKSGKAKSGKSQSDKLQSDQLMWHYRLDRSENAKNFAANFRRSFIAPILPRLVCAGTLWEGGTQVACVDASDGQEKWTGMMKFWAGISPQPFDNAMNAATLSGLTRRYPFSGVEMRFRRFEENGGRAAYYATDEKRLYFVPSPGTSESGQPNQGEDVVMTAFDFASFEPVWRLELSSRPRPTWAHAFAELGVVLFKSDETIYAADSETGELLWAATIGEDEPPVDARGGKLYMLVRRKVDSNVVFELDPRSGKVNWYALAPTGTLDLQTVEDDLILRSVRAVQRVDDLE